ncbi:MAG: peptide deformylase [Oscillospiraceae bacterium]
MAIRTIVQDGDPILKKVCKPVTDFNEKLATLLDDMAQTLVEARGLGLAGPQVGIMRRVCIVIDQYIDENDKDVDEIIELVNPEILKTEGELTIFEGCLSFPGRNGAITRPKYVTVRAQDRFGEWFELEAEDILARAICHECNHLDGITILDLATKFYEDLSKDEIKRMNLDEEYDDE